MSFTVILIVLSLFNIIPFLKNSIYNSHLFNLLWGMLFSYFGNRQKFCSQYYFCSLKEYCLFVSCFCCSCGFLCTLFFNTAHVIYQLFKGKLQTKFSLCSFILDFLTWFCGVTSVFALVFCSLEEFIQTSSIGEFRKRLQILFAFLGQNHISACLKINSRYNLFPLQLSFLENKREENSASF